MDEPTTPSTKPTWSQALLSALAAAFGVQSSKNRQRDFSAHSPWKFIVMGLVMTAIFIATILLVVKAVLPQSS
ncbi:MAG: DUF2970 domain-containing protein [Pseudomonadota bacterium]